jgi:integrase
MGNKRMVQAALTDQVLKRANPPNKTRLEYWDADLEGFGYRTSAPGKGSFFVMFRLDGKQRRMTIGRYPAMTLKSARARATDALLAVRENRDPALEEAARLAEEGRKRASTLSLAVADFLKLYPRYKSSTRAEVKRLLEKEVLPTLGERPVSAITRRDIAHVINAVSDRGAGTTANRLLAYLGAFFTWMVKERGDLDTSPIVNLAKPSKEHARDRVLTDDELRGVWLGAEQMAYPFGRVVQLLILTGQRRDEVAGMQKSELDLKARTWTLLRELTKSDRRHIVPLSNPALELIEAMPDRGGNLVFRAMNIRRKEKREEARHISGWSFFKRTLDEKALAAMQKIEDKAAEEEGREAKPVALAPYTLHDIRRTVASGMAGLGIAPHVVERLLNHSSGSIRGVAAVYNRHSYAPEMRHAVDVWAKHVEGLLAPSPSNVVVLHG